MRMKCCFFSLFLLILATTPSVEAQTPLCLSIEEGLDKMCARQTSADASCKRGLLGWNRSSCVNFSGNDVVQAIVDLKDRDIIPADAYRVYSTEVIARSIAYRFFQRTIRPVMTETDVRSPGYDMYNNAFPMVAFHLRVLPYIAQQGFLNQHQTGTGSGTLDRNARALAEDNLLNLRVEGTYNINGPAMRTANFLRPKYGFAVFAKKHASVNPDYRAHYGDVYAVFNNDVKKRAFITNQDSLDHYRVYPNVQLRINSYYSNFSNFNYARLGSAYYETQIWGALKFSDVRYLLVDCYDSQNARATIGAKLRELNLNIPVYKCVLTTDGNFVYPKPGQLLYGPAGLSVQTLRASVSSTINVTLATFGGNIERVTTGNATRAAANYCNTKTTCSYKISLKYLQDPAPNEKKSFEIRWTCSEDKSGRVREIKVPADSVDETILLRCDN